MTRSLKTYTFQTKIWIWPGGTAAWHFVNLPKDYSADIKDRYGKNARGWGSLPVSVSIDNKSWETSIFPDKKSGTYLLPVKKSIRRDLGLMSGDRVEIKLTIEI